MGEKKMATTKKKTGVKFLEAIQDNETGGTFTVNDEVNVILINGMELFGVIRNIELECGYITMSNNCLNDGFEIGLENIVSIYERMGN